MGKAARPLTEADGKTWLTEGIVLTRLLLTLIVTKHVVFVFEFLQHKGSTPFVSINIRGHMSSNYTEVNETFNRWKKIQAQQIKLECQHAKECCYSCQHKTPHLEDVINICAHEKHICLKANKYAICIPINSKLPTQFQGVKPYGQDSEKNTSGRNKRCETSGSKVKPETRGTVRQKYAHNPHWRKSGTDPVSSSSNAQSNRKSRRRNWRKNKQKSLRGSQQQRPNKVV